jgi:predicted RNase H-like HicB family nuclease
LRFFQNCCKNYG